MATRRSFEVLLLERIVDQDHSVPWDVSSSLVVTIKTTSFQSYLLPIDYARGDETGWYMTYGSSRRRLWSPGTRLIAIVKAIGKNRGTREMHLAELVEDSRSIMEWRGRVDRSIGGMWDVAVLKWTRDALTCRICHSNMREKISSLYLVVDRPRQRKLRRRDFMFQGETRRISARSPGFSLF